MSTQKQGEPTVVLGEGSRFEGKLVLEGGVRVEGTFNGEIAATGAVTVGAKAVVTASIQASDITSAGTVTGDLKARSVTLERTAKQKGDITASELSIERGASFDGRSTMTADKNGQKSVSGTGESAKTESVKTEKPVGDLTVTSSSPVTA